MSQPLLKSIHFVGYWKNQEIESVVIGCGGLSLTMNVKQTKNHWKIALKKKYHLPIHWPKKKKVTSEDAQNEKIRYADSPNTKSFESSQNEYIDNNITFLTENYYAIINDSGWYINRILEISENNC